MTTLTTAKRIEFDRITHDFNAYFETEYIGSFATYSQAENELNQHVLLLCQQGLIDTPLAHLAAQALSHAIPDDDPILEPTPEDDGYDPTACAVPDDQAPDDYSDCPAGPGEPTHTCDYHRDRMGRCVMCLTDEADALYDRLLAARERWPQLHTMRRAFDRPLERAHQRILRRIRLQGTIVYEPRPINLNDAPSDPAYRDGCVPVIAQAATVAALVLAALLR